MKKNQFLILFIVFIFNIFKCFAQQDYYWSNNQKNYINVDNLNIIAGVNNSDNLASLVNNLSAMSGVQEVKISQWGVANCLFIQHTNSNFSTFKQQLTSQNPSISFVVPTYKSGNSTLTPTPHIVVKPKPNVSINTIIQNIGSNKLTLSQSDNYNYHLLQVSDMNEYLSLANQIYETNLVVWAMPNFGIELPQLA